MSTRFYMPRAATFDSNGLPRVGARLYFYASGTSTPLDTYSDASLSVVNTNPVESDANGEYGTIFLSDEDYKVVQKTSDDVTIWTEDPVSANAPGDVVGPDSSTDEGLARFDGITGKLLQDGPQIGTSGAKVPLLSGANTWSGIQTLAAAFHAAWQTITKAVFQDYGETVNAVGSIGGGAFEIDLEDGNVITATVDTSETTLTVVNPPASGICGSFTLKLFNGGSQTFNWPASFDWAGGSEPTLTVAGKDVITVFTTDGGTTWDAFVSGLDQK